VKLTSELATRTELKATRTEINQKNRIKSKE
jgi:hypothetical protein